MTSQSAASAAADWARLVAVLLSRAYRTLLLTLSVVALAPMLFGYASFVIQSGSMEPVMSVGDVTVARPFAIGDKVEVGRVYVFDDPATSKDRLLTHRIVELRDDGSYTSAGDANDVTDVTAVTVGDMEARAILLVPYVGLPVAWLRAGQWLELALWLLLTVAAFVTARRNVESEPPKWNMLRILRDWRRERAGVADADATGADDAGVEQPDEASGAPDKVLARHRSAAPTALGVVLALALAGVGMGTANAAFTARSTSGSNTWSVGGWVQPYVSAVLADSPQSFWLLDENAGTVTAQDRSGNQFLGGYKPVAVLGQAGGLPNNPGTSISTSGALALTSVYAAGSPTTHTIEFWVKTADASGGYLTGFGTSTTTGTPSDEDRIVRMTTAGRLSYGDWSASPKSVITTPLSYNNNAWHHVVVVSTAASSSRQNTVIYVDGVARVSGLTSRIDSYNGYVRVGGGTGSAAFNGSIDNISVYGTALSAARVAAHYAAR